MNALTWCAAPILGRDGRPSFAKLVLIAVLALYAMQAPLPQLVAIAAIASSYGWKMFLAFLQRATFGLQALEMRSASTSESHETKDITVRVATDTEYDYEAGIDRRQL